MSGVSLTEEQICAVLDLIDAKIEVARSVDAEASFSYQDLHLAIQEFYAVFQEDQ